jgi:hypothetical protein
VEVEHAVGELLVHLVEFAVLDMLGLEQLGLYFGCG